MNAAATAATALDDATSVAGVRLRPIRASDLTVAQAMSAALRWPATVDDWRFALCHGAGVVAERDGLIVGSALRWLWGTDRASLGLVLVAPPWQRRGIGRRLMGAALLDTGRRHVLVHATPASQSLCEQLGLRSTGEVRQHEGLALGSTRPVLAEGERLRAPDRHDADVLALLDVRATGLPRPCVVRQLLNDHQAIVFERDGRAAGFSVLRRSGRGHTIGPVVAPDVASARALIAHWCRLYAGQRLRIDVDAESGLPEWLESLGLQRAGSTIAMVRGRLPPRGPSCGGWALLSPEVG